MSLADVTESESRYWSESPAARSVEEQKRRLFERHEPLGGPAAYDDQTIAKAARGSKNHANCLRLCSLARRFGAPGIIELGTNLGISSAYLALGASEIPGSPLVCTADASAARLGIARELHAAADLNVCRHHGLFDDVLGQLLEHCPRIGLAFIDGDHTYDGTWRYWRRIRAHMVPGGVVAFDDIEWSDDMRRVWSEISASESFRDVCAADGVGYVRVP